MARKPIAAFLFWIVLISVTDLGWAQDQPQTNSDSATPNFIVIFSDDQGYQDLGCFGDHDRFGKNARCFDSSKRSISKNTKKRAR